MVPKAARGTEPKKRLKNHAAITRKKIHATVKNKDRGFKVESERLKIVTELNPETIV